MSEIGAHPPGRIREVGVGRPDFSRGRFVLRFPQQKIIVAALAQVQETAHRHQEVQCRIKLLAGRDRQERSRLRPIPQFVHGGNQPQPARHVVVSQTSRSIFHVGFQMKDGVAVLRMARARDLGQALHQRLRLAHDQLGNHLVMEAIEKLPITQQVARVEQGNREFDIAGIEAITLAQRPGRGAHLHAQIPKLLRKAADGILVGRLHVARGVQKKNVDVGVRKQPAAPESAQRDQCESRWPTLFRRNNFLPESRHDGPDQASAMFYSRAPVTRSKEFLLDSG